MPGVLAAVDALVDLLLGERCAGCARPGRVVCARCAAALGGTARRCRRRAGCPPVWAGGAYVGRDRAVLLAFKDRGTRALAAPLGRVLAEAVRAAGPASGAAGLVLVPVPTSGRAARRRGYDPVLLLARAAARELNADGGPRVRVVRALYHRRRVADQVGLGRERRRANLRGALAVRPRAVPLVRCAAVVVVDDVVTSGATLAEAVRALRAARAGAGVTGCAVVLERV